MKSYRIAWFLVTVIIVALAAPALAAEKAQVVLKGIYAESTKADGKYDKMYAVYRVDIGDTSIPRMLAGLQVSKVGDHGYDAIVFTHDNYKWFHKNLAEIPESPDVKMTPEEFQSFLKAFEDFKEITPEDLPAPVNTLAPELLAHIVKVFQWNNGSITLYLVEPESETMAKKIADALNALPI